MATRNLREILIEMNALARELSELYDGRCHIQASVHDSDAYGEVAFPPFSYHSNKEMDAYWCDMERDKARIVLFKPDNKEPINARR